ncbi:C2 domain protein (macronuclear) [Tetrahymena thermophila SB210]|uniref:C2 domain protein n=1 Tax=Tetrahymena thermophila (strain SB210) TaxID=312017 RepID=I7LU65_TETTS|nr:C2 domain protein [Tetrahymena thermophila SB210]EAR89988.1 C2 domain protein [Tetrahymena thermophila SB210]|eukprot:XP_001010233.1 C2 domain protein [Tetrahymena thermophila SB210]
MNDQRSSLLVSLNNVEFQKDYHYFITCQLESEGEKRRTDISACVSNPVFTASTFVIPLRQYRIDYGERIHFAAFVVMDRTENELGIKDLDNKGQARLLGECILDMGPITAALQDIGGTGVRQSLKFTRISGEKEVTVGRFIVNLKLVGEQVIPVTNQLDIKPLEKEDIFHELPKSDPFFEFSWRVRVDIRSATDLPLNRVNPSGLPTTFVEVGWTLYDNASPDDFGLYLTNFVENNRHPLWNSQFLIQNPQKMTEKDGFIYICIKDKYVTEPIETIYIPIFPLRAFVPMNLELVSQRAEYEAKPKYFVSLTLEVPNTESFVDALTDVVVHNVHYDPLPYTQRMFLMMTLNEYHPQSTPFVQADLTGPQNLAKIIQDNSQEVNACFISTIMKIPPYQTDQTYKAVAVFTLPKSYLEKKILFFIAGRDDSIPCNHAMPNGVAGVSSLAEDTLKKVLFARDKKGAFLPVMWKKDSKLYPVFSTTKCMLELACFNLEDQKNIQISEGMKQLEGQEGGIRTQTPVDTIADYMGVKMSGKMGNNEKWSFLAKELSQKQEIIHRMIKEIDDKTESLKVTATEIVDLRRQIKLLQSENSILRKRLNHDEQLEVQSIVAKEIALMSTEELRQKILKLAAAYRDERIRTEDLQKALKQSQKDISQARQIEHDFEIMTKKYADATKKIVIMQQEVQKTQIYKETIKKQEKVIQKLERLIESTLKDTQKARGFQLELEKLKTENLNLQNQLKGKTNSGGENVEALKLEIAKLERVIADLQNQLNLKKPQTVMDADWENEKAEFEIKLYKAHARIEALQEELTENAKNYAKEIAQLKLVVAEKQAMLDTLTLGI